MKIVGLHISGSSFIISRAEEGNKIRLKTTYVDADGFDESTQYSN